MKILKLLFIIFAFYIFFFIFCSRSLAVEPAEVVFVSEIFWSGSYVSSSDEFVELKNNSEENIDLSGWQITAVDSSGQEYLMITICNGIIPKGGNFLISNSKKDHNYSNGESIINIDPDMVDSSISLSNSHLQIKLYNGQWDDGRYPVDIAGGGQLPLAGDNTVKSSMERKEPSFDGQKPENWQNTVMQKNLDFGSTEFATPESSGKPEIISVSIDHEQIYFNQRPQSVTLTAQIVDPDGLPDIQLVESDLSAVGGVTHQILNDDGTHGDITGSDNIYGNTFIISGSFPAGKKQIPVTVTDKKGLTDSKIIDLDFFDLSDDIKINEIFPSPSDVADNEFIELYNKGESAVNLYGWQLDDIKNGGSHPFLISDSYSIAAKGFLSFFKKDTKISLNNDGDTIRLINPFGQETDIKSYDNYSTKDCSFNRDGENWLWSKILTPSAENIISDPKSIDLSSFKLLSIKEAKEQTEGTQVTVVGYINSLPGSFSNYYFYIQDEEAGIEVYSHDGDFPQLFIGEKIKISGEISHTTSGWRIRIDDNSAIEVLEYNKIMLPNLISTYEVGEIYEGMLIAVKGEVVETSGNTFYLDDGSGPVRIYIDSSTGIVKPRLSKGMIVEVNGILTVHRGSWRIMPRFQADFSIVASPEKIQEKSSPLIPMAHAMENSDTIPNGINLSNLDSLKAKEITSSILRDELLIKITEIVIIISAILLILLIGQKYVKNYRISYEK